MRADTMATPENWVPVGAEDDRLLTPEVCEALAAKVTGFAAGGGLTRVSISSAWYGTLRWGRNRVTLASDRRVVQVEVSRAIHGAWAQLSTNQLDDASLKTMVQEAERQSVLGTDVRTGLSYEPPMPTLSPAPAAKIWSDATFGLTAEARGEVAQALVTEAEAAGMLSAGYLEVRAAAEWRTQDDGTTQYNRVSNAQCSMTVRDSEGTGSGWAGLSSYDWGAVDGQALAKRALAKCLASRNPVALEPGRYVVVLEPQAVSDLLDIMMGSMQGREGAETTGGGEQDGGPWRLSYTPALGVWRTKLGLKVMDERLTISHDPTDPQLGVLPKPGMRPVTWVDKGVLTTLGYDRPYAIRMLGENAPMDGYTGYRVSGGPTSVEEMIASTQRGILVTRFSGVSSLDSSSLLATGLTRDGLWLIENGKISKPIKNFRFVESPLFVVNQVEQLGPPVPVFSVQPDVPMQLEPTIVPPMKARDFSFTALVDAV